MSIGIMVDAPRRSTRARKKVETFASAAAAGDAKSQRKTGRKTKQVNGKKGSRENEAVNALTYKPQGKASY